MKEISILQNSLEQKFWKRVPGNTYYSNHSEKDNPFADCNNCTSCDHKGCQTCNEIVNPDSLIFNMDTEEVVHILKRTKRLRSDLAERLVFEGTEVEGYIFNEPTGEDLRREYPELYDQFMEG